MLGDPKKLVLLGLLAAILGARLHWLTTDATRAQLKADAQQLADLELQVRARERAYEKEAAAHEGLLLAAQRCLPSASPMLVIQLQNWLIEEAQQCGLDDVLVTPMPVANAGGKLRELPFKVSGVGDFESSMEVLERVTRVPLEHRVDAISLRSNGDAYEDLVEIDFSAYFLMLPVTSDLPALDPNTVALRLTADPPTDTQYVEQASLLCAEKPAAPKIRTVAHTEVAKKPPADRTGDIRQLGTFISQNYREVWIEDTKTEETQILSEGQSFQLAGISGSVEKVASDGVTLVIEGEHYVWNVAHTMKDLRMTEQR